MKKLMPILVIFLTSLFIAGKALSLPNCSGKSYSSSWNNCIGTHNYSNGDKYIGEYKDGWADGKGIYIHGGRRYVGEFKNDTLTGKGLITYADGDIFFGEVNDGDRINGRYFWKNGDIFVGRWQNNLKNGYGILTSSDGTIEQGVWKDGVFQYSTNVLNNEEILPDCPSNADAIWHNCFGFYTFTSGEWKGDTYVGEWKDNAYHGLGIHTFSKNSEWEGDEYVGEWKDNSFHGLGVYTFAEGTSKEGVWKDNEFLYASNDSTSKTNTSIPPNAHAYGSGWQCNKDFVKSGNSCVYNRPAIACLPGYYESGNTCNQIPDHAYGSSTGWSCDNGYVKNSNSCFKLPANSSESESELFGWKCNSGYIQSGNSCVTVTNVADNTIEVEFWNSIKDSDDPEEYRFYLLQFPEGVYASLAEYRIKKLDETTISVAQASTSIPNLDYGTYHALVIGNDKYRHLSPLSNAVNDANDVATLLRSKYQFNVNVLTNATRDEIVSALSTLRKTISSKDNLLVYYAGHGYLDKDTDEGYWLPVDAVDDDLVHWIANSTIINSVRAMKAKHVIVVADSCFSGTLTRGVKIKELSPDYLKEIVEKKARTAMTSGGLEPVSDVGGGNNSVFAAAFMRILNENTGVMDGHQFFTTLRQQVMMNADQTPEYGNIRKAGHDGGDFLFVRQ